MRCIRTRSVVCLATVIRRYRSAQTTLWTEIRRHCIVLIPKEYGKVDSWTTDVTTVVGLTVRVTTIVRVMISVDGLFTYVSSTRSKYDSSKTTNRGALCPSFLCGGTLVCADGIARSCSGDVTDSRRFHSRAMYYDGDRGTQAPLFRSDHRRQYIRGRQEIRAAGIPRRPNVTCTGDTCRFRSGRRCA